MAESFAATIRSDLLFNRRANHYLSVDSAAANHSSFRFLPSKPYNRVFSIDIARNRRERPFASPLRVVSDSLSGEGIKIQPDNSGGGGVGGGTSGGGGGGNYNNGGNNNDNSDEGDSDDSSSIKKLPMSMSQKLTLGFAALVGVGGVMGYLKSGSQKSLVAGGLSALLLYFVYTQLPSRPVFASSIGLGLSVALLGVMGSRFKKSGKIFPAGVVSLVSLVMSGGYMHGVLRSLH